MWPRIWSHLLNKCLMENFIFCATSGVIEEDWFEQNQSRSYYFTDPLREKKHKTLLKLKFWKVNFLASRYFPNYDAISLLLLNKINISIERHVHRQISSFLSTISKLWNICSKSQILLACLKLNRKICDAETCYRSTFPEMLWISCSEKNCNSVQKNNCHGSPSPKHRTENIYAFSSTS